MPRPNSAVCRDQQSLCRDRIRRFAGSSRVNMMDLSFTHKTELLSYLMPFLKWEVSVASTWVDVTNTQIKIIVIQIKFFALSVLSSVWFPRSCCVLFYKLKFDINTYHVYQYDKIGIRCFLISSLWIPVLHSISFHFEHDLPYDIFL